MIQFPPPQLQQAAGPAINAFVSRVRALLGHFRGQVGVNSWYRSPASNFRVGGDPCSQHLFAIAADLQTNELTDSVILFGPVVGLRIFRISRTAVHVQLLDAGTLERFGLCPLASTFA